MALALPLTSAALPPQGLPTPPPHRNLPALPSSLPAVILSTGDTRPLNPTAVTTPATHTHGHGCVGCVGRVEGGFEDYDYRKGTHGHDGGDVTAEIIDEDLQETW